MLFFLTIQKRIDKQDWLALRNFLDVNHLHLETNIEIFIIIKSTTNDEIVACAGLDNQTIKCVAIDESLRGTSLSLQLGTKIINLAAQRGVFQLFLYTCPKNKPIFTSWGFYSLVEVSDTVTFMENSKINIFRYCEQLSLSKKSGEKIGSIVMNANPFTLGHKALAEQAAKECDWVHVFVVKEDASLFTYQERFLLISKGLSGISNITIHDGSAYIISKATFPGYFLKNKALINYGWAATDLLLFRNYIAPSLGITHRFVGTEPFDVTTKNYNDRMKKWLEEPSSYQEIKVIEIPRITIDNLPVSATRVRQLIQERDFEKISDIVPSTTLDLILKKFKYNNFEQMKEKEG